jgi:hypothetical protein
MTKAELVARVAAKMSLTEKQTEVIVDLFLNSITDALRRGTRSSCAVSGASGYATAVRVRDAIPRLAIRSLLRPNACRFLRLVRTCERSSTRKPLTPCSSCSLVPKPPCRHLESCWRP